ncbi:hypothetical protein DPMN_057391 [Dreissena polymorpha]|uniref:Uncharacterized protein n=1 Tax=Dreissena polymorpha TaxID=45954 RepID=A0A9D4HE79_DREPO|nr:hypothetical protein DPMN_057391 [Dreissena polymorpha]
MRRGEVGHCAAGDAECSAQCGGNARENPALPILHGFARAHVLPEDLDAPSPGRRGGAVRVVTTPVSNQHTIVVLRVDLDV